MRATVQRWTAIGAGAVLVAIGAGAVLVAIVGVIVGAVPLSEPPDASEVDPVPAPA